MGGIGRGLEPTQQVANVTVEDLELFFQVRCVFYQSWSKSLHSFDKGFSFARSDSRKAMAMSTANRRKWARILLLVGDRMSILDAMAPRDKEQNPSTCCVA